MSYRIVVRMKAQVFYVLCVGVLCLLKSAASADAAASVRDIAAKPGVCPRRRLEVGVRRGVCAELCTNDSDCPGDEKCCSNGCGRQCTSPQTGIVKPGVCPRRRFGLCAEFCFNDSDCPGNEKCCSNGCGHQCSPPQIDIAKPGVCPSRRFGVGVCAELCSNDIDCPGNEKCCSNGCGRQCSPPYTAKPGVCPRRRLEVEIRLTVCAELCDDDSNCPGDEKCCSFGCDRQCTPPQTDIVKPGVCPRRRFEVEVRPGVCAELCANDSVCPGDEKCCSNRCGRQCSPPYTAKPGVCPRRRLEVGVRPGVCAQLCFNDSDCPGNEKCCSNGCGRQCTLPQIDIVKPGVCPRRRFEVEVRPGVCAELCANDSVCPGDEKCCSNRCGRQCTPPQTVIDPRGASASGYPKEARRLGKAKPGVCPRRRFGVGVCAELCANDSDCPGNEKCCSNGCGRQCTPPYTVKPRLCTLWMWTPMCPQ